MNVCAILNGVAGTVPFAGPALVANTWFPPNQRTTATAILSIFNYGGLAMAFVIGTFQNEICTDSDKQNIIVLFFHFGILFEFKFCCAL
jgi:nitrate/nitrite transporter NarK